MTKLSISGNIEIPEEIRNKKFIAYIKLLDTSYEDAPAVTISEKKLENTVVKTRQKGTIPFEITMDAEADKSHDYSISVHIDIDGDAVISKNDYIQQQRYTAISQGKPVKNIIIALQKV